MKESNDRNNGTDSADNKYLNRISYRCYLWVVRLTKLIDNTWERFTNRNRTDTPEV